MPSDSISVAAISICLSLAVILFLEEVALYTWQFRKEAGAKWFSSLMACEGAWLLALVFTSYSPTLSQCIFWNTLCAILGLLATFLWFWFIAELSGFQRKAPRWLFKAMLGHLSVFSLLMLTDQRHGWIWKSVQREGSTVHEHFGALGYLSIAIAYLICASSVSINVNWALRCSGLRRRQAWWFLVPNLIAWAAQFLSFFPHSALADPHTVGFLAYGLCVTWAYYRWRIYSVLPTARDAVIKTMVDGFMVIDDAGYIAELNAVAQDIFRGLSIKLGTRFIDAVQAWPDLAGIDGTAGRSFVEIGREIDGCTQFFNVRESLLHISGGQLLGRVFVIKEITFEKRAQAQLLEQQRALATLQERARVARELHDGLGQVLGYVKMQAQAARRVLAQGKQHEADRYLEQLVSAAQETHCDVREFISDANAGMESNMGFIALLRQYLARFSANYSIRTELHAPPGVAAGIFEPTVEVHLLRIVQEALANARKHGQASAAQVSLNLEDGKARIEITDDGRGFDLAKPPERDGQHFGLRFMRERAEEIGGSVEVWSEPDKGTRVVVQVPVRKETFQ